jgi:hypothetical protein
VARSNRAQQGFNLLGAVDREVGARDPSRGGNREADVSTAGTSSVESSPM